MSKKKNKQPKSTQPVVSKGRMYVILASRGIALVAAVCTLGALIGSFLGFTNELHIMVSVIVCLAAALVYRLTGFYYVDKKDRRRR